MKDAGRGSHRERGPGMSPGDPIMAEAADARCEAVVVDRVKQVTPAPSALAKRRRTMRLAGPHLQHQVR